MAGIPKALTALAHMRDPSLLSPSVATRIAINTGPNAFYGEKYRVEKVIINFICGFALYYYSHVSSRFSKMTAKSCLELLLLCTTPDERNFSCTVGLLSDPDRDQYDLLSILGIASPQLVECNI